MEVRPGELAEPGEKRRTGSGLLSISPFLLQDYTVVVQGIENIECFSFYVSN